MWLRGACQSRCDVELVMRVQRSGRGRLQGATSGACRELKPFLKAATAVEEVGATECDVATEVMGAAAGGVAAECSALREVMTKFLSEFNDEVSE